MRIDPGFGGSASGIDWITVCNDLQAALVSSCDVLVNPDNTLIDDWWILSQDRDRNSSSFIFNRQGKEFKVSLNVKEFIPIDRC